MRKIKQLEVWGKIRVRELLEGFIEMPHTAGAIGKACELWKQMLKEKATVTLALSGPLIASGLREVLRKTIEEDYAHVVVTSGANLVHDIIESLGGNHFILEEKTSEQELAKQGFSRIGNAVVKTGDFEKFENFMQDALEQIRQNRQTVDINTLLEMLASRIEDKKSFMKTCLEKKVPVFSPAVIDSMIGLQVFLYNQKMKNQNKAPLVVDAAGDMQNHLDKIMDAEKTGAIILGGGTSKHYTMASTIFRNGLDYAVQICSDTEETGSLSGARLCEGISWHKLKTDSKSLNVYGDVNQIFPLLVAGLL